jgi:hypothetical protein
MTSQIENLLDIIAEQQDRIEILEATVKGLKEEPRLLVLDNSCPTEVADFLQSIQEAMISITNRLDRLSATVQFVDTQGGPKTVRAYDLGKVVDEIENETVKRLSL